MPSHKSNEYSSCARDELSPPGSGFELKLAVTFFTDNALCLRHVLTRNHRRSSVSLRIIEHNSVGDAGITGNPKGTGYPTNTHENAIIK